jgi:hypothetical protein
VKHPRSEWRS